MNELINKPVSELMNENTWTKFKFIGQEYCVLPIISADLLLSQLVLVAMFTHLTLDNDLFYNFFPSYMRENPPNGIYL